MKVSEVMSKQVDYVSTETKVKDVCRLIFGAGINGVPVLEKKKVVGFITEKDILAPFFPSITEYIEDPFRSSDFEAMEQNVKDLLNLPVRKLMSSDPTTINESTPLLRAQSLMMVKKIGRLPVVDDNGNLVGIISRGDIFRAVVGDKLPFSSEEEYHDWLSKHYDLVVDWDTRLGFEIPDLTRVFRRNKDKKIIDVGFGTGEHDIALAKNGFEVFGVEASALMTTTANNKRAKLPEDLASKLEFVSGNYIEKLKDKKGIFDAAIFMGNALGHTAENYEKVLQVVSEALKKKGSTIVMQIINYKKVFDLHKGFVEINFAESKMGPEKRYVFLEFYDTGKKPGEILTLNMEIINHDGKKWKHRSLNSTKVIYLNEEIVTKLLKKHGFKNIKFYGSRYKHPLFENALDPREHDYLNIIATR